MEAARRDHHDRRVRSIKSGETPGFPGPGCFTRGTPPSYSLRVSPPAGRSAQKTQTGRRPEDLVEAANFIRAVRESGYLSLSTALAELIDNALQAAATTIDITIERSPRSGQVEIRVLDNGGGMSRQELESCLRFGGSSRFDDRESFGRFGMGLPAASLSQSRHVEVVAWQVGMPPMSVELDVDSIAAGIAPSLRPRRTAVDVTTPTGCLVLWQRCDRIEYRRLAWLERALHRDLGRVYRRFLTADTVLTINGSPVVAHDPLLLSPRQAGGAATLAFEPITYQVAATDGTPASVVVRFSALPVQKWHHLDNLTKRRIGVVGGGGVSIVRAGREIAYGWHLMGGKRKENYDDWWRCEIEFEPALDEQFGITINKQGIRPSAELREALESELESIARLLNARVRQSFEDVKVQAAAEASCRIAEATDPLLRVIRSSGRTADGQGLSYRIKTAQLSADQLLVTKLARRTLEVTLNVDHPAFSALYKPLLASGAEEPSRDGVRTALELMLLSFARASVAVGGERLCADLVTEWGTVYGRMLQHA